MAGGASEPLQPAEPGPAPLASEAGPPRLAFSPRRALRLAASLVLLLSTAGFVIGWWVWNRIASSHDQRLCRWEHHPCFF